MKPARLIILAVAVVAAGAAGLLAMRLTGTQQVVRERVAEITKPEPTEKVLVVSANLPVGARLGSGNLRWLAWPKSGLVDGLIIESQRPDAVEKLTGAVIRLPVFDGEPLRAEKIADSNSKIMSSLLPAGKRAVATEISVATGAGGFILPNDRVDVIMVRKEGQNYLTETVLANVRVLAIDQHIEQTEEGAKTVVGTTATLELTPDQAKVITVAQQMASRLSLALRSVADAQEEDTAVPDDLLRGGGGSAIQVIKSGELVKNNETAGQLQ